MQRTWLFGRQLGKCCKLHHNSNCTSSVGVIRAYVAPNYLALTCCTEVVTGIGYWNGRDIEREKAKCDFLSLYGKSKIYQTIKVQPLFHTTCHMGHVAWHTSSSSLSSELQLYGHYFEKKLFLKNPFHPTRESVLFLSTLTRSFLHLIDIYIVAGCLTI